ncbi:hypothetical protein HF086_016297 [Spodoptera exigua]|uniref:Uncharacterized protein n=1 Tax=Spodoptera exigua TaxID=7107 RepID=A0A922M9Y5_SPOEX|nr:hypothetical protein HF086_016297 [Spodoptera exigua]
MQPGSAVPRSASHCRAPYCRPVVPARNLPVHGSVPQARSKGAAPTPPASTPPEGAAPDGPRRPRRPRRPRQPGRQRVAAAAGVRVARGGARRAAQITARGRRPAHCIYIPRYTQYDVDM